MTNRAILKQRSDYTQKFNAKLGRFGWLRLTPAYSVKVVNELLDQYPNAKRVFDPFCGSGTTALSAAMRGIETVTTDINPFLVWIAKAKTQNYSKENIAEAQALKNIIVTGQARNPAPSIHNIERWWSPAARDFLCSVRDSIESNATGKVADLFKIAFCRTLIEVSNAAFNHQSMSFKSTENAEDSEICYATVFLKNLDFVLEGANESVAAHASILLQNACDLDPLSVGLCDLVITSPPYANRMSYIRELRPYMYWLGYLHIARDAGELDWQAMGGTWGIATSRLNGWEPTPEFDCELTASAAKKISNSDNKNGELLAQYVSKYTHDAYLHLKSLTKVLNKNARVHYIVGNSTFYGNLVSIEKAYAQYLENLGFTDVLVQPIRKRNSKKELFEYDVSGTYLG